MSMQRRAVAATRRGQARAKKLMVDDCKIERPEGKPAFDPVTGKDTQPLVLVYPSPEQTAADIPGRCQIQSVMAQASQSTSAEHQFTVERLLVKLPVGTPVQPGDLVTIVRSTLVPHDEGKVFRLVGVELKSMPTAARWTVEQVTS